jgi:hypothetical protein
VLLTTAAGAAIFAACVIAGTAAVAGSGYPAVRCPHPICRPGLLRPGLYTVQNFIPGMRVTIPSPGWHSSEDSTGEFNLHPPGRLKPTTIFFWLDPHPSSPCSARETGARLSTPARALRSLRANRNVTIEGVGRTLLARNVTAIWADINVPVGAPRCDPGCSSACIDYFIFQGPGFRFAYGTGHGEKTRLFFARIAKPKHLLVASIDAKDAKIFAQLEPTATRILMRLHLPPSLPPTGR